MADTDREVRIKVISVVTLTNIQKVASVPAPHSNITRTNLIQHNYHKMLIESRVVPTGRGRMRRNIVRVTIVGQSEVPF